MPIPTQTAYFADLLKSIAFEYDNVLRDNCKLRAELSHLRNTQDLMIDCSPIDLSINGLGFSFETHPTRFLSQSPHCTAIEEELADERRKHIDQARQSFIGSQQSSCSSCIVAPNLLADKIGSDLHCTPQLRGCDSQNLEPDVELLEQAVKTLEAYHSELGADYQSKQSNVKYRSSMTSSLSKSERGSDDSIYGPKRSSKRSKANSMDNVSTMRKSELTKKVERKNHLQYLEGVAQKTVLAWVHADCFGFASAFLIASNSIYIGIQTNAQVQYELNKIQIRPYGKEPDWLVGDFIFCLLFVIELILRVAADRMAFLFGRESMWNIFDSVVVFSSIIEVALDISGAQIVLGMGVLRALRVVRIIRLLRMSHNIAILHNLRTMLYSLAGSSTSFCAALILLTSVVYIFSLLFMQGVVGHLRYEPVIEIVDDLDSYYGTLDRTLWTLIGAVTGGYDWASIADCLTSIGPIYTCFFLLYISFVLLGLLNILNGIFVNAALQSSAMNRELQINRIMTQRQHIVEDMVNLFAEADVDRSGTVSMQEFEEYLLDEKIQAYFTALELDMSSVAKIFDLLDHDRTGELNVIDFVEGCIRLRGTAKMVDISVMQADYAAMLDKFEQFLRPEKLDAIETSVKAIANALKCPQQFGVKRH